MRKRERERVCVYAYEREGDKVGKRERQTGRVKQNKRKREC